MLRSTCGGLAAPVRSHSAVSTAWGGLEGRGEARFDAHLDSLERGGAGEGEGEGEGVVFDWPLRASYGCGALLPSLRVPSYFTRGTVSAYGPSLFAQRNGSKCGLHVDNGATHFWQHVMAGSKRWRIFAPQE